MTRKRKITDEKKRKLLQRLKARRHKLDKKTKSPETIKHALSETPEILRADDLPFPTFITENYVTLEDLHKNHFNLSNTLLRIWFIGLKNYQKFF